MSSADPVVAPDGAYGAIGGWEWSLRNRYVLDRLM